jgi:hypothetical protein
MAPFEGRSSFDELNKCFAIDADKVVSEATQAMIEDSINPEDKRAFYERELDKVLSDTITKDVQWSSLRLE